jgi:Icc-related predicted phosphoesterase
MKRIWHFSDTHTYHELLTVPADIDLAIFSGDCSNPKNPYENELQVWDFINWFGMLEIPYKIFVAGNHDVSIERGLIKKEDFESAGIIYLENDYITIEGIKIFGSPNQPTFGKGWAFNKARNNLDAHWKLVDDDVDIFISHGPPKNILDASYGQYGTKLEHCGCTALRRHILGRIKPKLCLFGHLHNNEDLINAGVVKYAAYITTFSNGSVVTDKKFGVVTSHGNILEI